MNPDIAGLRLEYSQQNLLEQELAADPVDQFASWWKQAVDSKLLEPNAMTLATASCDGLPAARIVLLKHFDRRGFVFYSNYKSYKGLQLEENPKASLLFFWKELERQVRIVGLVSKVPAAESDAYFASRPPGSRLGAIASPQSQVISNREWLDEAYAKVAAQNAPETVRRPEHWGGYVVQPVVVEFWQGRPSRLHDRIQYTLEERGEWKMERLAP